jgi:hypothetical protein
MPGTSDYTTEEVLDPVWIEKETSVKETRKPIAQSGRTSGTRYASDASDITPGITSTKGYQCRCTRTDRGKQVGFRNGEQ